MTTYFIEFYNYGFYLWLFTLIISILSPFIVCLSKRIDIITVAILIILSILHLTLAIYSAVVRFSHAGRVCSGDFAELQLTDDWRVDEEPPYLVNMGYFMKVYAIAFCCLSMCFVCALCFASRMIYKHKNSDDYIAN